MSIRQAVAAKYAPFAQPKIRKFIQDFGLSAPRLSAHDPVFAEPGTQGLSGRFLPGSSLRVDFGFPSPIVSSSLLDVVKVSQDLSLRVELPQTQALHADLALFAAGIREVPLDFMDPQVCDLTANIAAPQPRIDEPPLLPPVPETRDRTDLLAIAVSISENLLKPLGYCTSKGKDYAAQDKIELFPRFGEKTREKENGPRKAYTERKVGGRLVRKTLTLWDLILPLLKPPIDFNFPDQLDFPSELYPFQRTGVERLIASRSLLLGDEMGTGKTVMAVVALRILFHKGIVRRALIVCPANVVPVWDQHLKDWASESIPWTVVSGTQEKRRTDWLSRAYAYVVSYDTLKRDVLGSEGVLAKKECERFDLVILDEAHHIRNPESDRAKAVRQFEPMWRWALTGTPLQNDVGDLAAIFRFVKPGLFPREPVTPERARTLIEPFFLRRRKKDVFPDLPDKTRIPRWLDLDDEQRAAYQEILDHGCADFDSGKTELTRIHVFALLNRLKQICNFAPGKGTSPKVDELLDELDQIVDEHKAVVFTQWVPEGIEKLRPHLSKYGLVEMHGATPRAQRQRAIEDFQTKPDVRVFLATVKVAGEGITLSAGNYVFHFDHWWNPAVPKQAEDRVHRLGQKKAVTVYSYWMEDTIERRIYDILQRKGLLHDQIIEALSEAGIEQAISMEEWCEVLGLKVRPKPKAPETRPVDQGPPAPATLAFNEVYKKLSEMSPQAFEGLVGQVFRHLGYPSVQVTGQSHDEGIDVLASRSAVGGKEVVAVQCKRRAQVGVECARELLGAIANKPHIAKGFLVVSGELSPACRDFIRQHGNLAAIEGIELARRIVELKIPLPEE